MQVPLTLGDFLHRAELVYGERTAVVDEPSPPGGGLGRITYAQLAKMSRSLAAALDELGVAEGARVAIVSPNSARFLIALFGVSAFGRVLVPINFRLKAEEIRYIVEHSGSTVMLVDPEVEELVRDVPVAHRILIGGATVERLFFRSSEPALHGLRRDRARLDQQHVGHDGAAQGRPALATKLLAQRRDVRLAHRRQRPRRLPAHAADVPLQRLGHAVRADRHGLHPGRAAQGRRGLDPPAHP